MATPIELNFQREMNCLTLILVAASILEASPGIEIVNDAILMVDWRIKVNEEGIMRIDRTVVRGPEPIERYDCKNILDYGSLKTNCVDEDDE